MKEYISNYINNIDEIINKNSKKDINEIITEHLIKINFFQHERLIHLCVTLTYALFFLISIALISLSIIFIPITLILMIFLILYICHYFFLESRVQYMYKQYDKLKKIANK